MYDYEVEVKVYRLVDNGDGQQPTEDYVFKSNTTLNETDSIYDRFRELSHQADANIVEYEQARCIHEEYDTHDRFGEPGATPVCATCGKPWEDIHG